MSQKSSITNQLVATLAVSLVSIAVYHKAFVSGSYVPKSDWTNMQESIEPLLLDVIRQKPDTFFKVLNDAAQNQQERMKKEIEKIASSEKDKLFKASIPLGSQKAGVVRFVAFFDPMCPVSQEFQKVIMQVMSKRSDIAFHLVPLALINPNSEVMARFFISANAQKKGDMIKLMKNFIDNLPKLNRSKLLDLAAQSGFDVSTLEKGEADPVTADQVATNMKLAEILKVQGTPTVYVEHADGQLEILPPMDPNGFVELASQILVEKTNKNGSNKDIAKGISD